MKELFDGHTTLRAVVESGFEGHLGTLTTDDAAAPRVARIDIGCYAIFGGDPAAPSAGEWMCALTPPVEILVPPLQEWRNLIDECLGDRAEDLTMRTFSTHALRRDHLTEMASAEPPAGFRLRGIDLETARRLDANLEPHAMQVFPTAQAFVDRGLGVVAVAPDGRLAAQSSSYTISSRRVEIAIGTHPDFRRLGLARLLAARMILMCLDRGLEPAWSASNPLSKRLALSLGYRRAALSDVFKYERASG
jgi:GNAT superfamily N-acetyltransferase